MEIDAADAGPDAAAAGAGAGAGASASASASASARGAGGGGAGGAESRKQYADSLGPIANGLEGRAISGLSGGVIVHDRRAHDDDRLTQLLDHVSSLIWYSIQGGPEVQAMFVNGRLVVASNNKGEIERYVALVAQTDGVKRSLASVLIRTAVSVGRRGAAATMAPPAAAAAAAAAAPTKDKPKWSPPDDHIIRAAAKLDRLAARNKEGKFEKGDQDLQALLKLLQGSSTGNFAPVGPDEAAALLEKKGGPRIIFVTTTRNGIHAEQQLLHVLARANRGSGSGPVYFQGTKRPCLGCYLALTYAQDQLKLASLVHGRNPGLYWKNALVAAADFARTYSTGTSEKQIGDWFRSEARTLIKAGLHMTRSHAAKEGGAAAGGRRKKVAMKGSGGTGGYGTESDSDVDDDDFSDDVSELFAQASAATRTRIASRASSDT